MTEETKERILTNIRRANTSLKWVVYALLSGLLIGAAATFFSFCISKLTIVRTNEPWVLFLLPAGGLLIVLMYRLLHEHIESGTNLVLRAIQSGERVPLRMAPAIFIATLITHLFGGSVGREGAALQFGGSIGGALGRLFRFDEKDQHIMIMCGMSAAFSALFGTPMAAAIFSMEVISVGIMHYAALVPCVIASLTAHQVALFFGIGPETYDMRDIPAFAPRSAALAGLIAVLAGFLSILFCVLLHKGEEQFEKWIKNPYLRIAVGGGLIILMTVVIGNQNYNGTGVEIIWHCFTGNVPAYAFLLKMLFTAVTIGAGFKGGEIIPSLCVGAAFGRAFSEFTHFDQGLSCAVGMTALFCGVTNCPITSLLLSFELFGYRGMPYFLLTVALSYVVSGYYGLYKSQRIVYSKYKTNYINRNTH